MSTVALSDNTDVKSPDVGPLYIHERVMTPPIGENLTSKQALARNDKPPILKAIDEASDLEMLDAVRSPPSFHLFALTNFSQNDAVVEYDFSKDVDRGEDEDDGRDTMWYKKSGRTTDDVITISSDDDKDDQIAEWDLNDRPWKHFDQEMRVQWEMMYCHVTDYAMNGDWGVTEDYQHEKDKEMLRWVFAACNLRVLIDFFGQIHGRLPTSGMAPPSARRA